MKAVAVIPARYASTRLPVKPLLDICGKPLIQHVWETVSRARGLDEVVVATDDARIAHAVQAFGGKVCMTSPDCRSGSDRVREVAASLAADVYVNVQGDEPLLEASAIERLRDVFTENVSVQVATLCSSISEEQARSPHQVKVIRDHAENALYFSRAPLPFVRESGESTEFLGHVGIYAYRADALRGFASLPFSPLDTPEDLERVRAVVRKRRRAEALEKLKRVRLVITDVDGVLTDGGLYYGPDGECLKRFHARDGLGVRLLQQAGIQVAVLSGRDCPALRKRLADLGITEAVLGQVDKRAVLSGIIERCGVSAEEVAFIGDDIPDMEVFGLCGVSVTVGDASDYVKARADLVLECQGGQGAFRELLDVILPRQ